MKKTILRMLIATGAVAITMISGLNEAQADDSYTKLLLHGNGDFNDKSINNYPATVNGGVTNSSTQSQFGGQSMLFNGSNSYLTYPDSSDWDFGASDFTIDFWVYPTSQARGAIVARGPTAGNGTNGVWWLEKNAGNLSFYSYGSSTWLNSPVSDNTWSHVALVRNGGTVKFYVNGAGAGSTGYSTYTTDLSDNLSIGYWNALGYFSGYVDELRISKGIARWTANFTPPASEYTSATNFVPAANGVTLTGSLIVGSTLTGSYTFSDPDSDSEGTSTYRWLSSTTSNGTYTAISGATGNTYTTTGSDAGKYIKFEVTPVASTGSNPGFPSLSYALGPVLQLTSLAFDSNTKVLIHANNSIFDSAQGKQLAIVGNTTASGSQSVFGEKSINFDGNKTSVIFTSSINDSDFNLGNGNYTIDAWVYIPSFSNYPVLLSNGNIGNSIGEFTIYFNTVGIPVVRANQDAVTFAGSTGISANAWHHIAIVRSSSTDTRFYTDGIQNGSTITTNYTINTPSYASFRLGSSVDGFTSSFFIDEFRLSKGVARWSSSFVVPAQEYNDPPYPIANRLVTK